MKLASEFPDIFLLPKPKQGSKAHFDGLSFGFQSSNLKRITHKDVIYDYVGPHLCIPPSQHTHHRSEMPSEQSMLIPVEPKAWPIRLRPVIRSQVPSHRVSSNRAAGFSEEQGRIACYESQNEKQK